MQHEGMQPFQETHPPLSFSILASCVLPVEQQSDGGDHTNMGFGQQITLEHNGWLARIKPLLRLSFYIIFTHTHKKNAPHYSLLNLYVKITHCMRNRWAGFPLTASICPRPVCLIITNHEQRPRQGDRQVNKGFKCLIHFNITGKYKLLLNDSLSKGGCFSPLLHLKRFLQKTVSKFSNFLKS